MNILHSLLAACALCAGGVAFGQSATEPAAPRSPAQVATPDPWESIAEGKTIVKSANGQPDATYSYRLVEPRPAAIADPGAAQPLIVFLHGSGERGSDNRAQLKHFAGWCATDAVQSKHPCFVLAVQCPADETWAPIDINGARERGESPKFAPEPTRAMRAVMQAIDEVLATKAVDRTRVYLTGLSMGGFGAFDLAVRRPQLFAAVVPVCGGGDPATARILAGMPVLIVHGSDDQIVPVRLSRVMRDAIAVAARDRVDAAQSTTRDGEGAVATQKRLPNPEYREYAGVGHDSWTRAYAWGEEGVLEWVFARRLAVVGSMDRQASLPGRE